MAATNVQRPDSNPAPAPEQGAIPSIRPGVVAGRVSPVGCRRLRTPLRGRRPADPASDDVTAAQLAVVRLRALLVRIGDAIDLAIDSDWRVMVDILLDLGDEIHAELTS